MQRRADALTFGGTWVFPGGAVDVADGDPDRDLQGVLRRAAIRECAEEAGVRLDLQGSAPALISWSRWITPANMPRRFDTWFFAAALPHGQAVVGDAVEVVESAWLEPAAAIRGCAGGHFSMMPPALLSLIDLQQTFERHCSLSRLLGEEAARQTPPILPRLSVLGDGTVAVYPWDPEYPSLGGEGIELGAEPPAHLRSLPPRMLLAPFRN
jgi:8-oxo-dGTP pyrophosphatase MutT (NUDIX family)